MSTIRDLDASLHLKWHQHSALHCCPKNVRFGIGYQATGAVNRDNLMA
jgi:hypothetical protein